jgi:hypothetical protein
MPLAPLSRRRKVNLSTVLGELVQTTAGKWITHAPTRCPNGHTLGPNQVLVGHQACLGLGMSFKVYRNESDPFEQFWETTTASTSSRVAS